MLGGPVIQQHVVEFIRGSGVKTDGILDSTSANGPWTLVVPMGVAQILVTGCGAGSGGTGGTNATNSGGGGGGGTGMCFADFPVDVVQNSSLTISVGAKGTGGTPTTAATAGGDTTIAGVVTPIMQDTGTTIKFLGGAGGTTTTSSAGVAGLVGGKCIATGSAGGASASTPGNGVVVPSEISTFGVWAAGGGGGGGASTSGSTNGGSGSPTVTAGFRSFLWTQLSETSGTTPTQSSGNNTGTSSRGGGGVGGTSLFGEGGNGGNGGANGTNATGYGAGGGGGGGGANGGDGSDGYLRITYWSAD